MVAHPQPVALATTPLRVALLVCLLSMERVGAWVSTSPEGDISIRGDAEVRPPQQRHLTASAAAAAALAQPLLARHRGQFQLLQLNAHPLLRVRCQP